NTYTYGRLKRAGKRADAKLRLFAHRARPIRFTALRPGTHVVAGTILGRVGKSHNRPHVLFRIRPGGPGAPRIDPRPILRGWRLLQAAGPLPSEGAHAPRA